MPELVLAVSDNLHELLQNGQLAALAQLRAEGSVIVETVNITA